AFSPDGSSLYFSRRHSVGWDERRGRMPFYTAELLSSRQPQSVLHKPDQGKDISRVLVLADGRLLYSTDTRLLEVDPATGRTRQPEAC
ncbi:MAG TPA: hypothetical protein V6D23_16685, partial [Candidatus Obscuribacterales bacterium]